MRKQLCALLALGVLSGCTAHQPIAISSTSLGPEQETVIGVVQGRGSKFYFLFFAGVAPFGVGDDTFQAAFQNAVTKVKADSLVNIFADRRCTYTPHPLLPIFTSCETILTGTAIRYKAIDRAIARPDDSPQQAATLALQGLTAEQLYGKLFVLFQSEKDRVVPTVHSLGWESQKALENFVLYRKGNPWLSSWKFEMADNVVGAEAHFVEFFVRQFTHYKPSPRVAK